MRIDRDTGLWAHFRNEQILFYPLTLIYCSASYWRLNCKQSLIKQYLWPLMFPYVFPCFVALVCPEDNLTSLFLLLEAFHSHGAISGSGFVLTKGTADHLELSSQQCLAESSLKEVRARLTLHLLQYRPRILHTTCKPIILTFVLNIILWRLPQTGWCSSQLLRKKIINTFEIF